MTTPKESYPNEYWAFRLGRVTVELEREIVETLLHGWPVEGDPAEYPKRHIGDRYPQIEKKWLEIQICLREIGAGGQSNVATAVEDALKLWTKCRKAVYEAIVSAPLYEIEEARSNIIEEYRFDGDFGPYLELISCLRGMEPTKIRGRGRPRKTDSQPGTFTSPFSIAEWTGFQKHVEKVANRLSQSGSFYRISKSLHGLCNSDDFRINRHTTSQPATAETVKEESPSDSLEISNLELLTRLEKWARDQIDVLSEMGVKTEHFAVEQSSFEAFYENLEAGLRSVEESLKSYDKRERFDSAVLPEFHSMEQLRWEEATIRVKIPEENPFVENNTMVEIRARGVSVYRKASELGFASAQGKPLKLFETLFKFSKENGCIQWSDSKRYTPQRKIIDDEENNYVPSLVESEEKENDYKPNLDGSEDSEGDDLESNNFDHSERNRGAPLKPDVDKKQVSLLRKHLKSLMGIDDDPFYPHNRHDRKSRQLGMSGKRYEMKCTCLYDIIGSDGKIRA